MATTVVFVGTGGDSRTTAKLDLEVDEVGKRLGSATGFERFEMKGKPVWINPANVLWVTESSKGGAASW